MSPILGYDPLKRRVGVGWGGGVWGGEGCGVGRGVGWGGVWGVGVCGGVGYKTNRNSNSE